MIAFLHHRYRVPGGEEHAIARWRQLVQEQLGEETVLIERGSSETGAARAARGLLTGGLDAAEVSRAVRAHGARVVHAHNLQPTFGWRALAAAREAGARTVLHLHNYRLVCAVGTCVDSAGADCTACHARNTAPGVGKRCRGSIAEGAVYGAGLAIWQQRIVENADSIVVPSEAARARLLELGAPGAERAIVLGHPVPIPAQRLEPGSSEYVLVTARLAPEKVLGQAISACAEAGLPLVICGTGPEQATLRAAVAGSDVTFVADSSAERIAALRDRARVQLVTSVAEETFGLAAWEAMAAGLPVVASAAGALRELGPGALTVPRGDVAGLAKALREAWDGAAEMGAQARESARERCDPARLAPRLARIYDGTAHL